MKLFKAITSGTRRSLRASRQIIIMWFVSMLSLSLLIAPFRNFIIAYNDTSLSSELLSRGFDISFWLDMMPDLANSLASFSTGLVLFFGISFLLNVFMSGGLFDNLKADSCGYTPKDFFSASAKLFFPYLWVNLLVILIILVSVFLIIGLPMIIMNSSGVEELTRLKVMNIMKYLVAFILLIYLLVADYARAWLAASDRRNVFRAVGYGFKATFSSFVNSYIFILFAVALQVAFSWGAARLIGFMEPQGGMGLFLLFIVSQLIIIARIYLRAYRYAGVTSLYALG